MPGRSAGCPGRSVSFTPHTGEPLPDPGPWEETAEISFHSPTGEMVLHSLAGDAADPLALAAGPGGYRLRVSARGRDTAVDATVDRIVEWYRIDCWPAPPQPPALVRAGDRYGAARRAMPSSGTPRSPATVRYGRRPWHTTSSNAPNTATAPGDRKARRTRRDRCAVPSDGRPVPMKPMNSRVGAEPTGPVPGAYGTRPSRGGRSGAGIRARPRTGRTPVGVTERFRWRGSPGEALIGNQEGPDAMRPVSARFIVRSNRACEACTGSASV